MRFLRGMDLLRRAIEWGITTEQDERRLWLREKNYAKAPSEIHIRATPAWAFGGPEHLKFIDTYGRARFMHITNRLLKGSMTGEDPVDEVMRALAEEWRRNRQNLRDRFNHRTA